MKSLAFLTVNMTVRGLKACLITPGAKHAILNGSPLIHVQIYEDFINVLIEYRQSRRA
ncbi:hypothetical protein FHS21_006290 [Phyllobacterium trifolii]|uniref:Uncharacterized protein n=1 Tax=Phyllobacterium trifolii TaxID=300193 RepID=A0A839UJA2_9HYPH|nr:hypothetical protein [Phyllobacterium trifolii]MBB3149833.1 hypothetical protein [Phyllobacterium trifolii]